MHVDYDSDHSIHDEHKPLYEDKEEPRRSIGDLIFFRNRGDENREEES